MRNIPRIWKLQQIARSQIICEVAATRYIEKLPHDIDKEVAIMHLLQGTVEGLRNLMQ